MPNCEVPLCARDAHARGLCSAHYEWARRNGLVGKFERKHRPLAGRCCDVEGCERPAFSAHYCSMHDQRVRDTGQPGEAAPRNRPPHQPCSVDGCETASKSNGFCVMHYHRWKKYGDPGQAGRIRREKGTGSITNSGYLSFNTVRNEHQSDHRRVWIEANGPIPHGYVIHHRNGDKLDNRLENLQMMTRREHRLHHQDDLMAGRG